MISSLAIRDFALIENLRIELGSGLTIVTGETGAGKSIVVDALGLVLGERGDSTMVRDGAAKSVIEAELAGDVIESWREQIESTGAEWQSCLILRREVSVKGLSRCFINDCPVPVSTLKEFGDRMVDIHGQHEHQSLLRPDTHVGILDAFAGNDALLASFRRIHADMKRVLRELNLARDEHGKLEEKRRLILRQLSEIDAVNPDAGEDEALERELGMAEHAERLAFLANELLAVLYDGDGNTADTLGRARRTLAELSVIDASLAPLSDELASASAAVDEVVRTMRTYAEKVEYQPERCERLRSRLADIQTILRRFRSTLPELLVMREGLRRELHELENVDTRMESLSAELTTMRASMSETAMNLHTARVEAARRLSDAVVSTLADLGIPNARFDAAVEMLPPDRSEAEMNALFGDTEAATRDSGCDAVNFFLSTNLGEEIKPLAKVASGGEISRIMLALKSIYSGKSTSADSVVPVMVFDEIDTGVSGAVASAVGRAMKRLARNHQIIAVTHLPQIAACGDSHMLVEKHDDGKRTRTTVRRLDGDERVREIARLLSGESITEAGLRGAGELLEQHR